MSSLRAGLRGWLLQGGVLVLLFGAFLTLHWSFLEDMDALALDFTFRLRGPESPDSRIVIVAVDDASLSALGNWPWRPAVISELIEGILQADPELIGVDLLLSRPLEEYPALQRGGPVVLATSLGSLQGLGGMGWQGPQVDSEVPGISLAHIHAAKDADGVCRSIPLAVSHAGIRHWAFSVELARRVLGVSPDQVAFRDDHLFLGSELQIPRLSTPIDHAVDAAGILPSLPSDFLLLNSRGGPGTFPHVSARDVLERKPTALDQLSGRIVLLGATSYSLGDHLGTAFSGFTEMSGIEIHANALDTILNRRFITALEEPWRTSYLAAAMLVSWLIFAAWPRARTFTVFCLVLLAALMVPIALFLTFRFWLGLVPGVVAVGLAGATNQFLHHQSLNRQMNRRFVYLSRLLREVMPRTELAPFDPARLSLEWKLQLLGDATEAALRLSQERIETTSFVTHELKTPLTSIQGFSELLESGALSEGERREAAQFIGDETRRLTRMVNDYLRLARLEQGASALNQEAVDLAEVLERAAEIAQVEAGARDIAIKVDRPVGSLPVIGDSDLLTQVFVNLAANAVKFSPPSTEVVLRGWNDGNDVVAEVIDQGRGIPKADQQKVFDKFYRGEVAAGEQPSGSGLGLAFVKQVVDLHQGSIEIDSEVGRGTTFRLRLYNGNSYVGPDPGHRR